MMNTENIVTTVTNDQGRSFNVRLVRKGERYGLKDCITHDKDDALVEFYDATYENQKDFGPRGQFVAHYYWTTLTGQDPYSRGDRRCPTYGRGLALDYGIPEWTLTAANVRDALLACEAVLKGGK